MTPQFFEGKPYSNGKYPDYLSDEEIIRYRARVAQYMNAKEDSVYLSIASDMARLVEAKQSQYGDSFGNSHKVLEALYPNGISVEQYKDLLAIIRIVDKLFRLSKGDQGEESAWKDIMGYALLSAVREYRDNK